MLEIKTMDTSLGLLETGMRKKHEYGPAHPDLGKFEGEGIASAGEP
jgi:hypothetical protein